jgi:hypothetical protein
MGRLIRTDHLRTSTLAAALAVGTVLSVVVVALSARPAEADNTECTGVLPPGTYDNIVVLKGQTCTLANSIVRGNVRVLENSRLIARDNTIRGNLMANKADVVDLQSLNPAVPDIVGGNIHIKQGNDLALVCGQTLPRGNVHIEKFGPDALGIGVGDDEFCPGAVGGGGNTLEKGNIQVTDNTVTGNLGVDQNRVGGNILVYKNSGSGNKTVAFNTVSKNLRCRDNDPPFLSLANTVGGKNECPSIP